MNIHEHQAKELLSTFGVPILKGTVIFDANKAVAVAKALNSPSCWAVKAQIHAGGRGKSGGIKIAQSLDDVKKYAQEILGKTLVTPQTGPRGKEVKRLYIEHGCAIKTELYLSLLVDRTKGCISVISTSEGGVDIEEVAKKSPHKIIKLSIDPAIGLQKFHQRNLAFSLGLKNTIAKQFSKLLASCYQAFTSLDASLIELNPFVITKNDTIFVLDAKMSFDDNALYRHPNIENLRDLTEEDPAELEATKCNLSYIKLDGNIGCLVNGAGLAMATMDIIKIYGQEPANFLDVGGGATEESVTKAFQIILSDQRIKGILVNIFGGIMHCDVIAKGIVSAAKKVCLKVPLVVRLEGTNATEGKNILSKSGLSLQIANNLSDAAEKIVTAVRETI